MFMKSSVNMLVKIRQAVINHLLRKLSTEQLAQSLVLNFPVKSLPGTQHYLRKLSTEQLVWSLVLNFPVKSFRAPNIICES